ncbi:hypothetical protein [Mesorhizobium sp. M0768]|uniref:hypothetical protein n=1 Tax=Mesorhizobium sp. M0768 TaxID=2956996 RepID=UPI00333DDEBD
MSSRPSRSLGYQNHIAIDREHGLIRKWLATDAAAYEGGPVSLRLGLGELDRPARIAMS